MLNPYAQILGIRLEEPKPEPVRKLKPYKRMTKEQLQQAMEMRLNWASYCEIADKIGFTYTSVQKALSTNTEFQEAWSNLVAQRNSRIVADREAGLEFPELCKKYSLSINTVRKIVYSREK